jgi:hypothetical protein
MLRSLRLRAAWEPTASFARRFGLKQAIGGHNQPSTSNEDHLGFQFNQRA